MTDSSAARSHGLSVCFLLILAACAPAPLSQPGTTPSPVVGRPDSASTENPSQEAPRSGRLRQRDITVEMTAGPLRIQVTPLNDWILRSTAADTQARLTGLSEQYQSTLAESAGSRDLTLLLVSFFAGQSEEAFSPEDLHIIARGLRARPLAIEPLTADWGTGRVAQRSTQTAVYAFEGSLDISREMQVEYGGYSDVSWRDIATKIQAELGRLPIGR